MRETTDQNNSEYGYFLRSANFTKNSFRDVWQGPKNAFTIHHAISYHKQGDTLIHQSYVFVTVFVFTLIGLLPPTLKEISPRSLFHTVLGRLTNLPLFRQNVWNFFLPNMIFQCINPVELYEIGLQERFTRFNWWNCQMKSRSHYNCNIAVVQDAKDFYTRKKKKEKTSAINNKSKQSPQISVL